MLLFEEAVVLSSAGVLSVILIAIVSANVMVSDVAICDELNVEAISDLTSIVRAGG